jgi:hypothetical protein
MRPQEKKALENEIDSLRKQEKMHMSAIATKVTQLNKFRNSYDIPSDMSHKNFFIQRLRNINQNDPVEKEQLYNEIKNSQKLSGNVKSTFLSNELFKSIKDRLTPSASEPNKSTKNVAQTNKNNNVKTTVNPTATVTPVTRTFNSTIATGKTTVTPGTARGNTSSSSTNSNKTSEKLYKEYKNEFEGIKTIMDINYLDNADLTRINDKLSKLKTKIDANENNLEKYYIKIGAHVGNFYYEFFKKILQTHFNAFQKTDDVNKLTNYITNLEIIKIDGEDDFKIKSTFLGNNLPSRNELIKQIEDKINAIKNENQEIKNLENMVKKDSETKAVEESKDVEQAVSNFKIVLENEINLNERAEKKVEKMQILYYMIYACIERLDTEITSIKEQITKNNKDIDDFKIQKVNETRVSKKVPIGTTLLYKLLVKTDTSIAKNISDKIAEWFLFDIQKPSENIISQLKIKRIQFFKNILNGILDKIPLDDIQKEAAKQFDPTEINNDERFKNLKEKLETITKLVVDTKIKATTFKERVIIYLQKTQGVNKTPEEIENELKKIKEQKHKSTKEKYEEASKQAEEARKRYADLQQQADTNGKELDEKQKNIYELQSRLNEFGKVSKNNANTNQTLKTLSSELERNKIELKEQMKEFRNSLASAEKQKQIAETLEKNTKDMLRKIEQLGEPTGITGIVSRWSRSRTNSTNSQPPPAQQQQQSAPNQTTPLLPPSQNSPPQPTQQPGGSSLKIKHTNGRMYKVHIGSRGGKYIVVKDKKIYL